MAHCDNSAYAFTSQKSVFADLVNIAFGAIGSVSPDELEELSSSARTRFTGRGKLRDLHLDRDIFKIVYLDRSSRAAYVMYGFENQSYIDYRMPLRIIMYDMIAYWQQCREVTGTVRKNRKSYTADEFLSGYPKDHLLMPMHTGIVYSGYEPWNGPRNFRDMVYARNRAEREAIISFEPKIISLRHMSDMEISACSSELKLFADLLRKEKSGIITTQSRLQIESDYPVTEFFSDYFRDLTQIELESDYSREDRMLEVNVRNIERAAAKAAAEATARTAVEVAARTAEESQLKSIRAVMANGKMDETKAMDLLGIPSEERSRFHTLLNS